MRQPLRSEERGYPQRRISRSQWHQLCNKCAAYGGTCLRRMYLKTEEEGAGFKIQPPCFFARGPSPVAVIGASACTAKSSFPFRVNDPLLLLFKNTSAGGKPASAGFWGGLETIGYSIRRNTPTLWQHTSWLVHHPSEWSLPRRPTLHLLSRQL